jgi:Domain of unknown function (DUF4335)
MALQRIYSLPSCTLLVDGIGSDDCLSILTNFECRFLDAQDTISGGRNLLLTMIEAVSRYGQNLQLDPLKLDLSSHKNNSQPHPDQSKSNHIEPNPAKSKVTLEAASPYQHLLHVQAIAEDSDRTDLVTIKLSMVQLFDLIDSLDQLCLDQQTLPDLGLSLEPVAIKPRKSLQAQPIAIGIGAASLAIAVGAAFIIIPPLLKEPDPVPLPNQSQNSRTVNPTTPKPPSLSSDSAKSAQNPDQQITDPQLLTEIEEQLRSNIDKAWRNKISFKSDLIYVVEVDNKGAIVNFEPTAATKAKLEPDAKAELDKLAEELPLKQLQELSTSLNPELKTAKFLVTFSPKSGGTLTVKPFVKKVDP